MTIAQWIERCRAAMAEAGLHFGHGTREAEDEAAWLVLHACGLPCDGSFTSWAESVTEDRAQHIGQLLERRIRERMPLAYLLGEAWFCGLPFTVTPAVLVPRSPIAELITRGFAPWVDPERLQHVLELCTGSGCIAAAIAHHLPGVGIDATDLSAEALEVAMANIARHGFSERIELHHCDLFGDLAGRQYDLIVTNPPYVPATAEASLPPEYLAEPGMGLFGGSDGLDLVLRILAGAAACLDGHGVLICEVGESAGCLQGLLPAVPFTWIEFEHGGEGVFTIGRQELVQAEPAVRALLAAR